MFSCVWFITPVNHYTNSIVAGSFLLREFTEGVYSLIIGIIHYAHYYNLHKIAFNMRDKSGKSADYLVST